MPELDDTTRIALLEQALWGPSGQNGVVGDVKALRREFASYRTEERVRREHQLERDDERDDEEQRAKRVVYLMIILGLVAAIVALIGTVAQLMAVH